MTSDVRYTNTTPTATDFKGTTPPIVVDRAAGKAYVLASGDVVTEVGASGGGAPTDATYIVQTANGTLTQERVATDTATIAWDFGTAGQAKLNLVSSYALASRAINTTAPLSGGGDLSADRTLSVATFSSGASGVVPASGGGSTNFLRADGTWAAPAGASVSFTEINQDLGSTPKTEGQFNITSSSLTVGKPVHVFHLAGPGTSYDDPDKVVASGIVTSATNIQVNWSGGRIASAGTHRFAYYVGA